MKTNLERAKPKVENQTDDKVKDMETESEKPDDDKSLTGKEGVKIKSFSSDPSSEIPKGKVACLLCRGFISYKNTDRKRFKSHMEEEHDVEYDSDVVLACSVLSKQERDVVIKAAMARLNMIGNGQQPTVSNVSPHIQSLVHKPPQPPQIAPLQRPSPTIHQRPTISQGQPSIVVPSTRGRPPSFARGRGRGGVRTTQPIPPRQPPPLLGNNSAISISVVDQRVQCSSCKKTFANGTIMAEHMKADHMTKFPGLTVATPKDIAEEEKKKNTMRSLEYKQPVQGSSHTAQRSGGGTPINVKNLQMLKTNIKSGNNSPYQSSNIGQRTSNIQRTSTSLIQQTKNTLKSSPRPSQQSTTIRSPRLSTLPPNTIIKSPMNQTSEVPQVSKDDHVMKCNICGKFIKQSQFNSHKLIHIQERKDSKAASIKNVLKQKRKEEKVVDFVDLSDDSESDNEESNNIKQTSVKETIACNLCDKKLATYMALKMHMNLRHPVKQEVDDTEALLSETTDNDLIDSDKIKSEVEGMETLELLDNLVNFLETET